VAQQKFGGKERISAHYSATSVPDFQCVLHAEQRANRFYLG